MRMSQNANLLITEHGTVSCHMSGNRNDTIRYTLQTREILEFIITYMMEELNDAEGKFPHADKLPKMNSKGLKQKLGFFPYLGQVHPYEKSSLARVEGNAQLVESLTAVLVGFTHA